MTLVGHRTKVLVLDLDNTLVLDYSTRRGSLDLKDAAWLTVYGEYRSDQIVPLLDAADYGFANRYLVARYVSGALGFTGVDLEYDVQRRCTHFNQCVQDAIRKIGIEPDACSFLEMLLEKHFPVYINTATPRESALESLRLLGIAHYFRFVFGYPGSKSKNLIDIMQAEGVFPKDLLFVDDQPSGWSVAQEVGCLFAGMHTARTIEWHTAQLPFLLVSSLKELAPLLDV